MTQAKFLPLIDPISDTLLRIQKQAYEDFDRHLSDPAYRLSVEGARPKTVNERIVHLLAMEFGKKGKRRMVEENGLNFLLLSGPDFDLGIRPKKLDGNWRSYQAHTIQQDELRTSGVFDFASKRTYHLFLGYRDAGEIEKRLTHVAVTWERIGYKIDIIKMLWTEADGMNPATEFQPDFDTPPKPRISAKKRKDSDSRDAAG